MANDTSNGEQSAGTPSLETSALLRRLGDVSLWELEVTDTFDLNPTMRRIRLTAPGLSALSYRPGQDLMLAIPGPGGASMRRRYTIRAFDPAASTIDIDAVLHGDGPGATWASTVVAGGRIEAIGPRGKVMVRPDVDWHLFVGDDSAIPASLAMAESLAAEQASVVLEVDSAADEQRADSIDGQQIPVRWLHRDGADPASSANLVAELSIMDLPAGRGHAYVAGELKAVADMRRTLLQRGLEPEQISAKPYWRAGRANAANGEPERPPTDA